MYPVSVVVQQQHPRAGHLLGLHHRLQIGQQAHVLGHVRGQNLEEKEGGMRRFNNNNNNNKDNENNNYNNIIYLWSV